MIFENRGPLGLQYLRLMVFQGPIFPVSYVDDGVSLEDTKRWRRGKFWSTISSDGFICNGLLIFQQGNALVSLAPLGNSKFQSHYHLGHPWSPPPWIATSWYHHPDRHQFWSPPPLISTTLIATALIATTPGRHHPGRHHPDHHLLIATSLIATALATTTALASLPPLGPPPFTSISVCMMRCAFLGLGSCNWVSRFIVFSRN